MKNIDEKILMAEEEIKQLQNKRKKLISQQKQDERKKRDRRLYEKGAVFESIFTESKDFTKDEFYQLITFPNIKEEVNQKILKIIEKREQGEKHLILKNADSNNTDLEKYVESYQFLKEKNIASLSELKESISALRDKNYKTTRAIKDTEKKIDGKVQLIDQADKYLKHKDTYKAYTKLKKSKQEYFYNEHTAEFILFESSKKYLKEHLGESKTLNISKWKSEVITLRKEKDTLYSQIIDMRKEVERAEKVKICIERLQEHSKQLAQSKNQDLEL